jgi:TnpA family transposase
LPTDQAELAKHYLLSDDDLELVQARRREENRLGFAVQLCLTRYPGRLLRVNEQPPRLLLAFIADQVGADADAFDVYAKRAETRREHALLLLERFELTTFKGDHLRELVHWLVPIAVDNPKGDLLVGAVLNELRRRRILHPDLIVIERLVAAALGRADRRVLAQINGHLSEHQRRVLDGWLVPEPEKRQSRFSCIRQPVGRPCPANLLAIIERLRAIRELGLAVAVVDTLPTARRQGLSREGNRVAVHNLRLFSDARRHALMAVTLLELKQALVDDALGMHDRIIARVLRRGKRRQADALQADTKRIKQALGMFATLGKALIDARDQRREPWDAIEGAIPWERLCAMIEVVEDLGKPRRLDPLGFIETHYPQIRRYAPAMLEEFDFQAAAGGENVLAAIELLRSMNATGKRKLPKEAPTSFVAAKWEPFVRMRDGLDRRYYELCALSGLRDHLRSGDIWVPGSRQYQDFERYLLGPDAFAELLAAGEAPVAVETDFGRYMAERSELLTDRLDEVHGLIEAGELNTVEITRDGFSIKPYRGTPVPNAAKAFVDRVNAALPRIKITDLLVEVDGWTGFSEQFTHLRSGLPTDDRQALLSVILADGINLGLTRMAEAAPGSSFKRLSRVADWHVREDCYSRALAEVVNQHHQLKLAYNWGDGTTSSSDGQHFPLGSVGQELGHRNPKYGSRPVVIFYTHISDQYSPYHTKCIATNARDATYVLDGLLYHDSDLVIEEHYTDTAGFTDQVFGLCHLLGFRFAPRIRDIGERRLYPIRDRKRWPKLEPTFGGDIRLQKIETQWDEILRAGSSIRLGTVTASLLVRKLASYPRQNRLALAMREFGRIERTLFLLNWMQDPTLRARVQAGLNKGEAKNALSRAVFFNRLGELRDRSFEGQSSRASGLNLLAAAIVLWNTRYLERAVEQVRREIGIPDEYLQYLSPLGWEHINLTGDYIWNLR